MWARCLSATSPPLTTSTLATSWPNRAVVLALSLGLHIAAGMGVFEANTAYADPRLPLMMAVFSLSALLQGAESMQLASAQRELHVGHLARLEIFTQLSAMVVTLVMAWATHSVWSLLVGTVFSSLVRTLLSHFYLPGHSERPCWDRAFAHEIFGFGKWIFISSVIGFLAGNGEKLILGATLVTASFGVFSIAATLLAATIGVYSSINGHVVFSSLSIALRSEKRDEITRFYTRAQQFADLFLGGLAGLIFMSGHWAVWLLYDKRYQDAGWMLQWLALGLVALRQQVVEQLMFARGKPSWVSANNTLRAVSLVVFIPLGFLLAGERGAIAGVVISQFASWPFSMKFKYDQGLLTWATEKWWVPALILGMMVGWLVDLAFSTWAH